jgi:hypothetical protein
MSRSTRAGLRSFQATGMAAVLWRAVAGPRTLHVTLRGSAPGDATLVARGGGMVSRRSCARVLQGSAAGCAAAASAVFGGVSGVGGTPPRWQGRGGRVGC